MIILAINLVLSSIGAIAVFRTIPAVASMFISAGLFGNDLCKKDRSIKVMLRSIKGLH